MPLDPRQTWQYFAHAVIQEDDPAKLTYLMQQLYSMLKDNQEKPSLQLLPSADRGTISSRSTPLATSHSGNLGNVSTTEPTSQRDSTQSGVAVLVP
jgi:hypothetical protein